ncbi:hypothetical protein HRI_001411100 [Hibiscus trionum]|uniref:Uncharacterized protein n=1 Tax=Hibiscus trionum TaxID=183268 RepID=A0A9W7LUU0_HIBTR|nr:hypothetical protein HRI_001411100 [Hibiscus trionum]
MNGRMLERDEDLLLFRELHKREKDRIATLLQPVSDEFEPASGNFALYRISSGKKGSGFQFFPDNNKNDYDWLKTPPATPLFPSLEMEANAAQPVVQRELPIIRPFSRFAGHSQKESANSRPKSPNPKPKCLSNPPSYNRPKTQLVPKTNIKAAPTLIQPTNYDPLKSKRTSKQVNHKDDPIHFLTANLSKNPNPTNKTNPRSRGVSPLARSTIPVEMRSSNPRSRGVSPLARSTNPVEMRSSSAARGRLVHQNASSTSSKTPRQSCSPCVTRGRRVEETKKEGKGTQILGSKMVERVMNARKTNSSVSIDESQRDAAKQKLRGETRDFARTKHLHMIKRDYTRLDFFQRRGGQH